MSTRYKGSLMSSTAATTSTSSANGIWRTNEAMQAVQASAWPVIGGALTPSFTYLVVAGGGSGGSYDAGGGGAGGLLTSTVTASFSGSYTVTVGGGGASVGQNG